MVSLADKFFHQNDLIIQLRVQCKNILVHEDLSIRCLAENVHVITFSHQKFDGMRLLLLFCPSDTVLVQNSSCFDFCLIPFFHHYRKLRHRPYINVHHHSLDYESLRLKTSTVKEIFPHGRFTSFLCALQVYTYSKMTHCQYCKLQIIHYIPWMEGINKTFPDVLIINTIRYSTFHEIYDYINKKRKSTQEIWSIYSKYRFFTHFIYKMDPVLFDVTFSNLSIPIDVEDIEILFKSSQYEKSYMNVVHNNHDEIFFSFVHDSMLENFSQEFLYFLHQAPQFSHYDGQRLNISY